MLDLICVKVRRRQLMIGSRTGPKATAIERVSLHSFSTKTRPGLFRKWKDLLNLRDNFRGQKTASRTETNVQAPSDKKKKLQTAF